ncbi:MAG: MotA/TolQ/ExbB proton channel family protein [Planctomycetota bacterium]|jgi:biopolymer transport protein ExbB|nr:MotA/TolQ/ExbB proton channel family protein [Planctomycetota bacterium]MDA1025730.1 MotA/TolQ/ExbB proton channel family protein [Planctomycetota bacterium]
MTPINAFLSFMERGGLVMWPLLFLSVVTVSIVLERGIFWLRLDSRRGRSRYRGLAEALRRGDRSRIAGLVDGDDSPYASLARDLLESTDQVDEATAAVFSEEIRPRFERGLLMLSAIVTAAPMLGILGTVIGIIQSFELLGGDATITDPNQVSGGIAEALITTATGLVVALLALFPYMLFRGRQDRAIGRLESLATSAIAGLAGSRSPKTLIGSSDKRSSDKPRR